MLTVLWRVYFGAGWVDYAKQHSSKAFELENCDMAAAKELATIRNQVLKKHQQAGVLPCQYQVTPRSPSRSFVGEYGKRSADAPIRWWRSGHFSQRNSVLLASA